MAKTTMKAQEVRVAQSVAQGQQVRPSVRSRDCHGLSGLLCHSIHMAGGVHSAKKW